MSTYNLDAIFRPASIAVFGASNRAGSLGKVLMGNLVAPGFADEPTIILAGSDDRMDLVAPGFAGPIMPINPKAGSIGGIYAYNNIEELPIVPELAVLCTPAGPVPALIDQLGERGTRAVVIITAGFFRSRSLMEDLFPLRYLRMPAAMEYVSLDPIASASCRHGGASMLLLPMSPPMSAISPCFPNPGRS